MSDEQKVIAELEDFMRVTEFGQLQEWNDAGGHLGLWIGKDGDDYIPGSVLAELLADAVRRLHERIERELNQPGAASVHQRIDYVESRGEEDGDGNE